MNNILSLFHMASACGTSAGFLPSLYDGISCPGNVPEVRSLQDVGLLIANVMRILIALSGGVAVILLLVASIYFITSTGDSGRVKRARDIIINTVTGLVIIILSYAFVTFIAGEF